MSIEDARALTSWSYENARRECEARVVRWEWATFHRTSLEPGFFEIRRYRRGDLLEEAPDPPQSGARAHGFDTDGMLVMERSQVEFPGRFYETFYARRAGGIARRHFHHSKDKAAINSSFFELDGDLVTRLDTAYAPNRQMTQLYTYDARGRLVREERTGPEDASTTTYEVEWEGAAISRVRYRRADGRSGIQFERPRAGDSLAQRRAEVTTGIAGAIIAAISAAPPADPVYAIGLWWCSAEYQHRFPPNVSLATAADRERFVATHGARARDYLWSPPEWRHEVVIDLDPALSRVCELVNADVWQHDHHEMANVVVTAMAAAVGASKLTFPVTEDVVAFGVNVDAREPPEEQLARQLTSKRRAAFARRGWLAARARPPSRGR